MPSFRGPGQDALAVCGLSTATSLRTETHLRSPWMAPRMWNVLLLVLQERLASGSPTVYAALSRLFLSVLSLPYQDLNHCFLLIILRQRFILLNSFVSYGAIPPGTNTIEGLETDSP